MTNEEYSKVWSEAYTQGWCDSFQNNHKWAKDRVERGEKFLFRLLRAYNRPMTTSADIKLAADVERFLNENKLHKNDA